MASSSSSSPYSGPWKYDVFVCFRGETRWGFTSGVVEALAEKKIKTFMDTMLEKTESITELVSILKCSAISVVILSPSFAESTWCLDEVAAIADSVVNDGHRVLPVFYNVDPSDVTDDTGRFDATINSLQGPSLDAKRKWKGALRDVIADKAGLCFPSDEFRGEYKLIKAIVDNVNKKLEEMAESLDVTTTDKWVGMDSRIQEIQQLPEMKASNDHVTVIGLWGMGGTGKTATARALHENLAPHDCKNHFLSNINNRWDDGRGLDDLLKELYSALLAEDVTRLDMQRKYKRARLMLERVFVILDEVETWKQLQQLLLNEVWNLTSLFAPGSRIIVTSRNRGMLDSVNARVYPIEGLVNPRESLQLFSWHAFGLDFPPGDDVDWKCRFSTKAVSYCKGNPLALMVLGGALVNKDEAYWLSFLDGLGKSQEADIYHILRRSYDKLESDDHKNMFLDIACFFNRSPKSRLINIMRNTYTSEDRCIVDLVGRSLLVYNKFDNDADDGMIEVHDLLLEMAWKIIKEKRDPRKRSRLEDPEDICIVLTKEIKADGVMEGLSMDLSKTERLCLKSDAFLGMDLLRWLMFYWPGASFGDKDDIFKVLLPNGLDYLPRELRILNWDSFPCTSLPSQFSPRKLVELTIRYSAMEQCWEGVQDLENLRWVDFTGCINLRQVPDLSKAHNLEVLKLKGCIRLVELPLQIQDLDKLMMLDLRFCENLGLLPPQLDSPLLKIIHLSHCPKLSRCPEITNGEWQILDLDQTPVTRLPDAVHKVKRANLLSLYGEHVTHFPPFSPSESTFLKEFQLSQTSIEDIATTTTTTTTMSPVHLPKFGRLELNENSKLASLSSDTWRMVSTELVVRLSPKLHTLPEVEEESSGLTTLELNCCELGQLCKLELSACWNLQSLPDTIHQLAHLIELYLIGCIHIPALPQLPTSLRLLAADGCWSLQSLPEDITSLNFYQLSFAGCLKLGSQMLSKTADDYLAARATSTFDPKSSYTYPGREIPKWFGDQETEDAAIALQQLPENCKKLKGVAFAVVFSVDTSSIPDGYSALVDMKCDGRITDHGAAGKVVASWDCMVGSCIHVPPGRIQDHVFVWLDVKGEPMEVTEEAWYVKYSGHKVSFRFYSHVRSGTTSSFRIKKCGARLIF
ncbi:Disease resistance-like protein DSC1 [Linum perenne]